MPTWGCSRVPQAFLHIPLPAPSHPERSSQIYSWARMCLGTPGAVQGPGVSPPNSCQFCWTVTPRPRAWITPEE